MFLAVLRHRFCSFHRHLAAHSGALPKNEAGTSGKGEKGQEQEEAPWKDPYKHAVAEKTTTFTEFREVGVNWDYVRRLLPRRMIPEMPHTDGTVTPSGWRAPKATAPNLPYYIRRAPNHMPAIYLERRRDELNPKTMNFDYAELVNLRGIHGDIFACERDLRIYLEQRLGHPVATQVDELKGMVRVKGADRTLVEQFVYDCETEFRMGEYEQKGDNDAQR